MVDDAEVISDWFTQYSDDVYQFLIYYAGADEAEDLVQEVFIKAYNGLNRFRYESSPKTWLFAIARSVAIDHLRIRKRQRNLSNLLRISDRKPYEETSESIAQLSEEKGELLALIQSLKKDYRDVLILRGIQELSVQDTAIILGWSHSKVSLTFHRALKGLSQKYKGVNANG